MIPVPPILVTIIAAVLAASFPAHGQLSPGPLSAAHSKLEGATKCTNCHTLAVGAPKFKCLACHAEIRDRIQAKRGFHGQVVKSDGGSKQECVRCHTEHYGPKFNIIKWETSAEEFDHRQTGFPLTGKHAGRKCEDCHSARKMPAAERAKLGSRDLKKTFLGLSTACASCHTDVHQGQLGGDCAKCHTSTQGWKPAAGFQHSQSRFALTGLHQGVVCGRCHATVTVGATALTKFKGLDFDSCADCHKDPHQGAFPGACQTCHTTQGWKRVDAVSHFDHGKTVFPLLGAHEETGCFKCHRSSNFKEPVAHGRCADCHRDDPHTGQFAKADCGSCHTEKTFKTSTFDTARHQKSVYPLAGKHAAVLCGKCHEPAGKKTRYRIAHDACLDCHKDAHTGQFAASPIANACQSCHNEQGFAPSTFTFARHQRTRFSLTGGHAATPCMECHKSAAGVVPPPPPAYRFESLACVACHTDPHPRPAGAAASKYGCTDCHTTASWSGKMSFDHAETGYRLEGAHRAVTCTGCHKPQTPSVAKRLISFPGAPRQCAPCHEDIHRGQFQGSECGVCHKQIAWRPTQFNHETGARFSLAGAHQEVPCSACHRKQAGDGAVVLYRQTPRDCAACHGVK